MTTRKSFWWELWNIGTNEKGKHTYYPTRKEAEAKREKGNRIYYKLGKGYYIVEIKNVFLGK
jgi:hypothetical protein